MWQRLVMGLLVVLLVGCSGNGGATTTSGESGTSDGVTAIPVLEPVGDIVAQECPVPQEVLPGAAPSSALGVCTYFPLGVFGAARVPATADLMPQFVAGAECLLLWSVTGSIRTCFDYGSAPEPVQPDFPAFLDDGNHGYKWFAALVPEGTTRLVAGTTDGADLVAIPSQGIALLWWPRGAALASLYAETPAGPVRVSISPG